jgi:hypothetical protein
MATHGAISHTNGWTVGAKSVRIDDHNPEVAILKFDGDYLAGFEHCVD